MAQLFSEAVPELSGFNENDAGIRMVATGGVALGAAAERLPEWPTMRPSREIELALARLDWRLVAIHEMDPQAVSQFTRLAISLISGSARRRMKRVLLTSAHSGEGRTCVALNLAAALARARQRALVIDTDLRRPSMGRLLGIESDIGLAEAIALGLRPQDAIIRVLPADFHVMLTRGQVDNSAELLASLDFKRLLLELDDCYDFILFDSAPMLKSADASLLGLLTSATILVTRPGVTSTEELRKSISLLNEENFFGVVMNQVDDRSL
ncbi:MAG: CpsD/CapB family tyrosine-protein kinase [Chloracidobacterium sp.]|nr:CpsD/CapB family tyrosine-protein kinase [Chloracidobacterium sp.]